MPIFRSLVTNTLPVNGSAATFTVHNVREYESIIRIHLTSGGMSATATITPMRAAGAPVVKASVPAEPAARARIRSLEPIDVLAAMGSFI